MPKRSQPPLRIGPLQIIKGEVVTDPVEIARMEKLRLQLRKRKRGGASKRTSA